MVLQIARRLRAESATTGMPSVRSRSAPGRRRTAAGFAATAATRGQDDFAVGRRAEWTCPCLIHSTPVATWPLKRHLADLRDDDGRMTGGDRRREERPAELVRQCLPMPSSVGADAKRRRAVEVGIARQADLDAAPRPTRVKPDCRCCRSETSNSPRAAVILAVAAATAPVAAKIGQQFAIAPALGADALP